MAKNVRKVVMSMKEKDFQVEASNSPEKAAWLKEALTRTEVRETYPRVKAWNAEKGKYTYVADKTAEPVETIARISFFSLKEAYCDEVLKLPKKENEVKETFRDRMLKAL